MSLWKCVYDTLGNLAQKKVKLAFGGGGVGFVFAVVRTKEERWKVPVEQRQN